MGSGGWRRRLCPTIQQLLDRLAFNQVDYNGQSAALGGAEKAGVSATVATAAVFPKEEEKSAIKMELDRVKEALRAERREAGLLRCGSCCSPQPDRVYFEN